VNDAYLPSKVNGVNMISVKPGERPKRGYHHGDLKNALLETALRLVVERGPEGFSLREAARDVGVSPGAAYRHFADKNALLSALAADGHGRLATHMERALARIAGARGTALHAVGTFAGIGQAYVEFAVRHPAHFRVMFGPCLEEAGFEPGLSPSGRDAFQILVDSLDALVTARVIDPAARPGAELVAWAMVHGLAALVVEGAVDLSPRERSAAVAAAVRTMLAGLGADPVLLPAAAPAPIVDPRQPAEKPARAAR
jgi:AcrR family transcriptional regulator